jgi:cytochrome c oxidase subunit 3
MSSESAYYVPESSKLPIMVSAALAGTVFGASHWLNGSTFLGLDGIVIFWIFVTGFAAIMFNWWSTVVQENLAGLPNAQLKRSYVWGMGWFIFSEVMFFFIFFFALFYVRNLAVPWIAEDGLFPGFVDAWPVMVTPDQAALGEGATKFVGPKALIDPWHLPLLNTIILITSSFTVHLAHNAIKAGKRSGFNLWLLITVILGATFLFFQVEEYADAYENLGLTLQSGIYGTTFFLLTGFHGAHVTMGTIMLATQLIRSYRGQFKADDHFGFEAASWYWHFVDVVWVALFIFVYIL